MASSKQKGAAKEAHAAAIYERLGYRLEKARPVYRYINGRPRAKAVDLFGLFDLVGKRAGARTLWVQVKSQESDAYAACKAIRESGLFDARFDDVHVLNWLGASRPGAPGAFQVRRLDDDFATDRAMVLRTDADRMPWEEPDEPRTPALF